MQSTLSGSRLLSASKKFTVAAAVTVMLASLSVLLGWATGSAPLKGLMPGLETTKPLGALGLLCAGAALLLLPRDEVPVEPWRRSVGLLCAAVTLLIGGLTLVEQGLEVDLGIDRLLFPEALKAEGPYPGRPVFPISACLALLGLALATAQSRARRLGLLVLPVLFVGLLVLIGYLYGAVPFYRVEPHRPVPVMAALLVVVVALGYLSAQPGSSILEPITTHRAGGITARRLLPAAILLPLAAGWLRLVGERAALYDTGFGVALFATLSMTVFVGLVYASARRLNQADALREASHAALQESEERLRRVVDATPAGLMMVAPDGRITLANATAERLFGYGEGRLAGQPIEALVPDRHRAGHEALRLAFGADARPRLMGAGRDLVGLRADGVEFPAEIGLSPVDTPQGRLTLVAVADITERKRRDDEIRSLNAGLEARVAERTGQLDFERARWRGIVESVADEVWMCDGQGRMSLLNLARVTGTDVPAFKDKSSEEIHRVVDVLFPDGQPRPPDETPLLRSLGGEIVQGEEILRDRGTGQTRHRQFASAPMRGADGAITGAVAVVRDVTERKRAEAALRQSEERLNQAEEIAHLGSWELDLLGDRLSWSDEVYRIFGLAPQEFTATYSAFLEAVHPEDRAAVDAAYSGSIRDGRDIYEVEHRIVRRKSGEVRFVHEKCEHFRDESGRIVRSVGMVHDVTERERTRRDVLEIARQRQLALNAARMGWWHYDPSTRVATWDERCKEIFGVTGRSRPNEEILARLHPDDRPRVWSKVEEALDPRDPKPYSAEHRINLPDGTTRWIEAHGIASFEGQGEEGRATSLVGTVADITGRRRAQAQLTDALREKEVLLKEIHHRVKNNLQLISSLLRLQSGALDDPRLRELIADSERRVRAMALIHEQLYQAASLARVDLGSYVLSLVNHLRRSHAGTTPQVEIRVTVEDVIVEMDQAVPLGLLVSELVSNSLKHAFPTGADARGGEVFVVARREPPGRLILIVGDNGVGLPDHVDLEHPPSMGLQLVGSFVAQLQGQLAVQRRPGTVLTVTIPEARE